MHRLAFTSKHKAKAKGHMSELPWLGPPLSSDSSEETCREAKPAVSLALEGLNGFLWPLNCERTAAHPCVHVCIVTDIGVVALQWTCILGK